MQMPDQPHDPNWTSSLLDGAVGPRAMLQVCGVARIRAPVQLLLGLHTDNEPSRHDPRHRKSLMQQRNDRHADWIQNHSGVAVVASVA